MPSGEPSVDAVDSLLVGFMTPERAAEIEAQFPGVTGSIVGWIQDSAAARNWRRVERLANLAARLQPPGLGRILRGFLDSNIAELNNEDVVEILGEIREVDAAGSIFRLVERSLESDAPAYWLSQKAILALSDLETSEATEYLHQLTQSRWPDPIRWHAAVALQIEDDLGFEEDEMLDHRS